MTPLIRSLLRPQVYPHPVERCELLETHISWVILAGDFAYKIKKPVDFGFVNFTTLERRQSCCREELRLNGRLAPGVYLEVVEIFGPPDEATFLGSGEPIEFAVRMRRFPQENLLPAVLAQGRLRPDHLDRLADDIAQFQARAEASTDGDNFGTAAAVAAPVFNNFTVLDRLDRFRDEVGRLKAWATAASTLLADRFAQRKRDRRVREGHGDMHLGNMVLLDDAIRVFDCIEFNASLRWIDVISELAFLVMDLQERGRPDCAFRVLNRWLEESGDHEGLAVWRWYIVYRAMVRAKVAALRLDQGDLPPVDRARLERDVAGYLRLGEAWTRPAPPVIMIMHGFSGSGKSWLSQQLCERLGAVRLRSDVERKRMHATNSAKPVHASDRLAEAAYAADVSDRLYREVLTERAAYVLDAGFPLLVDAAFLQASQRAVFRELADRRAARFVILEVVAPVDQLRARIQERNRRGVDVSDADVSVLEQQLSRHEPLSEAERTAAITVDTSAPDCVSQLLSRLTVVVPEAMPAV